MYKTRQSPLQSVAVTMEKQQAREIMYTVKSIFLITHKTGSLPAKKVWTWPDPFLQAGEKLAIKLNCQKCWLQILLTYVSVVFQVQNSYSYCMLINVACSKRSLQVGEKRTKNDN